MTEQPVVEPSPSQLQPFREMLDDDAIMALVRPTLGELSFDGVQGPLQSIQRLLDEAIPQEQEIPAQRVAQAVGQLDALRTLIKRIPDFAVTEANPSGTRNEIMAGIHSYRDSLIESLRPAMRGGTADLAIRLGETERALAETRDMNARLEALIGQTRQGQVEIAGERASDFFEAQAAAHEQAASRFLWGTIGLSVLLVAVVVGEFIELRWNPPNYNGDLARGLAESLPKLTLLLIISFGVGFSARNYRVNKHLFVLNKTKSITIQAADRYAAAVDQPAHRDLVVASLVQSVLTLGDTGYLPVDSERTIIESPGAASMLASTVPKT